MCPTASPKATDPVRPPSSSCASAGAELVITVDCGAAATSHRGGVGDRSAGGGDRPSPDARRSALARSGGQPQPAGLPSGRACWPPPGSLLSCWPPLIAKRGGGVCSPIAPEPDLRQWLDLAALGAICDVTQLVGFNAGPAAQGSEGHVGLDRIQGLKALMDVAGLHGRRPAGRVSRRLRISDPGSTPAAASAEPISAPGCFPPMTPPKPQTSPEELDALNTERKQVEQRHIRRSDHRH